MKIGIIADTHDNMPKIVSAVRIFNKSGVEVVIHAGDYVAPFALRPFEEFHGQFYGVLGNNDGETEGLRKSSMGRILERSLRFELGGAKFYLRHSFEDPEGSVDAGDWKYLVCGHTHKARVIKGRKGMFINPGEACGWVSGRSTAAILDTASEEAEIIEI